ncbi:DUF2637 domain-containing protein [Streptomyces sp. NPDC058700]|uniref:DUF2637 domain-containing protein n=1 Tax=unclassified Streptomyces TaxID=2593676 RepID=UPI003647F7B5
MNTHPAGDQPPYDTDRDPADLPAAGHTPHAAEALTPTQKTLIGVVSAAVLVIATLGFIGSYAAVTKLARAKGFGSFSDAFPVAVDAGIIAFLALDLLLTWRRIPYPVLRHTAWGLTAATIAFNAAAAWPDALGVGMHSVIPILFVIAVEAARHAVGRIADITADKHIESPPFSRWLLNPAGTFVLWRRQRMWNIRSWETVLHLEQETRIYRAQLRREHGRGWRRKAGANQLLVLRLARDGMSIQDAIDLPHREAQKLAEAEAKRTAEAKAKAEAEAELKHQAELRKAGVAAKRRAEVAEAEAAEAEARARAEAAEVEAKARSEAAAETLRLEVEAKRRAEAEAARLLVAETEAKLAAIAREQQQAEFEAELKRLQQDAARRQAEAETRRLEAAAQAEAERQAREEAAQRRAQRIAAEAATRSDNLSPSASTSGSGSDAGATSETASDSASGSGPRAIGGQRSKRQAEVEAVLARLVAADDPKCVSLEDVMRDFGLKQTTAYDRLATAQTLYAQSQTRSA